MNADTTTLVYINAGNDRNGNPRRGWIIGYGTRNPRFCDEGYAGSGALEAFGFARAYAARLADSSPALEVAPREYRKWLKIGKGAEVAA